LPDTLGSIRAEVLGWLRGDLDDDADTSLVNASINDALESIWSAMMQVQLARFFGLDSPVAFTLPSGAERVQLVSIPDPTAAPALGHVAGGSLGSKTVLVGYTLVSESGSETQLSPTASVLVPINQVTTVVAVQPLSSPAFGWNCYASPTGDSRFLALQNQQPLPFDVAYQEPQTGWLDYPAAQPQPPQVQAANVATPALSPPPSENTTADNISWITHLEVRTSDTLLRSWRQYGLDSEVMRRSAATVSSASERQGYAWDLINGNRLEIRPAAGMTFNARYFYIAKPRRLRYDQAQMPYVNITGVHEFIVAAAIAKCKLALDEYMAHGAWDAKANATKQEIRMALVSELWGKDTRVVPYLC